MRGHLAMLLIPALLAVLCCGQQATQPVPADQGRQSPSSATATQSASSSQENERMFGVLPTYSIVNGGYAPPLTPGGKFKLFVANTTDPFVLFGTGLQA